MDFQARGQKLFQAKAKSNFIPMKKYMKVIKSISIFKEPNSFLPTLTPFGGQKCSNFSSKTGFSQIFCLKCVRVNFCNFHSVIHTHSVEKWEILSHWKFFSSNQLFSNFFSKTIAFTKFLRKKCEREFLQFPHCAQYVWKDKKLLSPKKYFVKSTL